VHGARHQFLAGAGFTQQQHGGLRWRHAGHQGQHALKSRSAPNQALRMGLSMGHLQGLHAFHEEGLFAVGIAQRRQLDIDVFLALGRVVQVQYSFALARFTRLYQGAGLACLVARHMEMVRHLVAGAPHDATLGAELAPIRRIGGQDAVLRVEQDVWLGQALQVGNQFGQRL
jgi:hypothetical protein